jgi:hypothetical protein
LAKKCQNLVLVRTGGRTYAAVRVLLFEIIIAVLVHVDLAERGRRGVLLAVVPRHLDYVFDVSCAFTPGLSNSDGDDGVSSTARSSETSLASRCAILARSHESLVYFNVDFDPDLKIAVFFLNQLRSRFSCDFILERLCVYKI